MVARKKFYEMAHFVLSPLKPAEREKEKSSMIKKLKKINKNSFLLAAVAAKNQEFVEISRLPQQTERSFTASFWFLH